MEMTIEIKDDNTKEFCQELIGVIDRMFDETQHSQTAYIEDQYGEGDDGNPLWRRAIHQVILVPYEKGKECDAMALAKEIIEAMKLVQLHVHSEGSPERSINPVRYRLYWRAYPTIKKTVVAEKNFSPAECEYYIRMRLSFQPFYDGDWK